MADYSSFVDLAVGLVTEFGIPVTISHEARTGFDPETGAFSGSSDDDQDVVGIFVGKGRVHYAFESLAQAGDREMIVAASSFSFEPAPGDVLETEAGNYDIIAVQPVEPADTVIVYRLLLRR